MRVIDITDGIIDFLHLYNFGNPGIGTLVFHWLAYFWLIQFSFRPFFHMGQFSLVAAICPTWGKPRVTERQRVGERGHILFKEICGTHCCGQI